MKCYQHSRYQSYCSHEPVLRKVIRKWALNKNDHRDFNWRLVTGIHGATCRKLNEAAREKILCIMALWTDMRPSAPSKTRMKQETHMAKKKKKDLTFLSTYSSMVVILMLVHMCWCWYTHVHIILVLWDHVSYGG